MPAQIVVAVDDRHVSQEALALGGTLARATGAGLVLVNVYPYERPTGRTLEIPGFAQELRERAEGVLETLAEPLRAQGATVAVVVKAIGGFSPARVLHALSERAEVGLLVVGPSRRGRLGRVLAGATGEHLLHGAACPLALAPAGYEGAEGLRRVGVGFAGQGDVDEEALVGRRRSPATRERRCAWCAPASPRPGSTPGWPSARWPRTSSASATIGW